jgi:hypothetical protein
VDTNLDGSFSFGKGAFHVNGGLHGHLVITASASGLHISGSASAWGEVKVGKLHKKIGIGLSLNDHGFELKTPSYLPHLKVSW